MRGVELVGEGSHVGLVHLAYLAVIGQQSVGLILHIADLRVNGGAEAVFDGGQDLVAVKSEQIALKGLGIGVFAVAVGLIEIEECAGSLSE